MIRLLLPVDFSEVSDVQFEYVERLRKRTPAETVIDVTLLHVVQMPFIPIQHMTMADQYGNILNELKHTGQEQLVQASAQPWAQGCVVHLELRTGGQGAPHELVHDLAQERSVDYIVVGVKRRKGLDHFLSGSELGGLLRGSHTPVLCLRPGQVPNFERILYATDFSEDSLNALLEVARFAKQFNGSLSAVRVVTPGDFATERDFRQGCRDLEKALLKHGFDCNALLSRLFLYNAKTTAQGILHCAEDNLSDLIVMATRGRKGFSRLLHGSVTEELVADTELPCLVLRLPD